MIVEKEEHDEEDTLKVCSHTPFEQEGAKIVADVQVIPLSDSV